MSVQISTAVLLPEQAVGILREPHEVLVDTPRGLGEVRGGMVDSDRQIAKFSR